MTLAEAAVAAGYEPEDEKYVPTVGYFSVVKALAAMKVQYEDLDPKIRNNQKARLLELVNAL